MLAFIVTLLIHIRGTLETCPLQKEAVPETNVKFSTASFDDNNLALLVRCRLFSILLLEVVLRDNGQNIF